MHPCRLSRLRVRLFSGPATGGTIAGMAGGTGRATARVRWFWRAYVGIYTLFFAYPAADLVTGGHSPTAVVLGAVGLAAFLALYLPMAWVGVATDGRRDPWLRILACAAIAVAATLTLGGIWSGLLTYTAFVAGGTIRRTWVGVTTVLVTALTSGVAITVVGGDWSPSWAVGYVTVAGFFAVAIAWLLRTCDELDRARAETARLAVADERLRFARDLHDLLGHSLSVIALKSELAGRLASSDPEGAAAELRDIESVTRQALAEVRAAVTGYRAEAGLGAELERARLALTAAGVDARVQVPDDALPAPVDELFAWTVREATTNVVRHASARHCTIRVRSAADGDRMEVVDDGVGADGGAVAPCADGHGLGGLTERVTAASGRVEATDLPDGGFRLVVQVPR